MYLCTLKKINTIIDMNFVEELRWRGMIQEIMPGTEEQLQKELTAGYVGIEIGRAHV